MNFPDIRRILYLRPPISETPRASEEDVDPSEEPMSSEVGMAASWALDPSIETPHRSELHEQAKHRLEYVQQSLSSVDWRHFALINNAFLIVGSSLDTGISMEQSFSSYLTCLTWLQKHGSFFSSQGIDPTHPQGWEPYQDMLRCILEESHKIEREFCVVSGLSYLTQDSVVNRGMGIGVEAILSQIDRRLEKGEPLYVSLGSHFIEGYQESGHAVTCKITLDRERQQVKIAIFNLGLGSNDHPLLSVTSNYDEVSYSYYPAVISQATWKQMGPGLITAMIRLARDRPYQKETLTPDMHFLYDLIAVLRAFSVDEVIEHAEVLKAKPQTIGDCADKSVRYIMTDFWRCEKKCSQDLIDIFYLNLHFVFLIAAYHDFKQKPEKLLQNLFVNACEEFSVALLRSQNKLPGTECLVAIEMLEMMACEVQQTPLIPPLPLEKRALPVATTFQGFAPPQSLEFKECKETWSSSVLPLFCPQTCARDYAHAIRERRMREYLVSMPIPEWGKSDVWDQVPLKDIPDVLSSCYCHLLISYHYFDENLFEIMLLCAVVDKLSRRLDTEGVLKRHYFPCTLDFVEPYVCCTTWEKQLRFNQSKDYFKHSQKAICALKGEAAHTLKERPAFSAIFFEFVDYWRIFLRGKNEKYTINRYLLSFTDDFQFYPNDLEIRSRSIFLPYAGYTHNRILCMPVSEIRDADRQCIKDPARRALFRDLLVMLRHKELQMGLVKQWVPTHLDAFDDPMVRQGIELVLFSADTLSQRLAQQECIDELRIWLQEVLETCAHQYKYYYATAFFVECGIRWESYIADFKNVDPNQEVLNRYEDILRELKKHYPLITGTKEDAKYHVDILQLQYQLASTVKCVTEQDFIRVFLQAFEGEAIMRGAGSLLGRDTFKFFNFSSRMLRSFYKFLDAQGGKKQKTLDRFCNHILSYLCGHKVSLTWELDVDGECCHCEQYRICFVSRDISHRLLSAVLGRCSAPEKEYWQLSDFKISDDIGWWWIRVREELSGFTVVVSADETIILARDSPFGDKVYCLKGSEQHKVTVLPRIDKKLGERFSWMKFCQTSTNCLVGYEKGQPYAQFDFTSEAMTVTRLDQKGRPLPYKLANLEHLDPQHPFYNYTLRFAPADHILCFIDEKTQEIQELQFPTLNLHFIRTEKGLEERSLSGYCWIPGLEVKALKGYSRNAFVLRHANGSVKVILVIPEAPESELNCQKPHVVVSQKTACELYIERKSTVFFLLSSLDAPIVCRCASEQLILAHFFMRHEDYKAALALLKKLYVCDFDKETYRVIHACLDTHRRSKSLHHLIFMQKFLLFLVDHLENFENDTQRKSILTHSVSCYLSYQRAKADDRINRIPVEWRLTENEEQRILLAYQHHNVEIKNKVLQARMALLLSASRSATVTFDDMEVDLAPKAFDKFQKAASWRFLKETGMPYKKDPALAQQPFIMYPVQVPAGYILHFFEELYEEARAVPAGCKTHPFDITLLALFNSVFLKTVEIELVSLLCYVRSFPHKFPALQKGALSRLCWRVLGQAVTTSVEDFNKIVAIASRMPCPENISNCKVPFPYKRTLSLSLPPKQRLEPQSLPRVPALEIERYPFQECFTLLFHVAVLKTEQSLNLFEAALLEGTTLEQAMVEKYTTARDTLVHEPKSVHTLQRDNIDKVRVRLKKMQAEYRVLIQQDEKDILKSSNHPFQYFEELNDVKEEKTLSVRMLGRQTHDLTPEWLMKEVILKNSRRSLTEHRPMLQEVHVTEILAKVHRYYHHSVLAMLCREGIDLLQQIEENPHDLCVQQKLIEILEYQFSYVPEEYPEIAYMKLKTGKLPRSDQLKAYMWVCEGLEQKENRLYQLGAGGGKTSYMTPLLILRSLRLHLVPYVSTTQAMYGVEKEALRMTLAQLGMNLCTLEIGMHTELSEDVLKGINLQFIGALQAGHAFMITPQTYYLLRLSYFIAVFHKDSARADLLSKLRHFMAQRCLLIGDESHRNFDPLTQAIYGVGDFLHLTHQEQDMMMALMKPLLGIETLLDDQGRKLSELSETHQHLSQIQKTLAEHLCEFFALPQAMHKAMVAFLIQEKDSEPTDLKALCEEKQHLLRLARYFLTSLLAQVIMMKTNFDHIVSYEQGGIETPAHYKTPSHAQFKSHYLTCALSIKGLWHRGMTQEQCTELVKLLQSIDAEEQKLMVHPKQTYSETKFSMWVQDQGLCLRTLDMQDEKMQVRICSVLSRHPEAMEYFLRSCIFTRIGCASEHFASSPTHLMNGFKCSVLCSATPIAREIYPKALQGYQSDDLFEARVLRQSAQPKNQNFVFPRDVDHFFVLLAQGTVDTKRVRYMIDAGGFLCRHKNEEIAKRWLKASELEGVVFFKEDVALYQDRLCFLSRQGDVVELNRLEELKSFAPHICCARVGIFYDASHAESAHFDPQPHTDAVIFSGKDLSLSHAIQSIMRARGFFK